jgi:hypothetical protein
VHRRRSSLTPTRATAHEVLQPKSLELENRVARLELVVNDLRGAYDDVKKRLIALQAQLDHIAARLTGM